LTCVFWAENAEKKCKGKNNSKNKGNIQSLRPSGFAPAFGRAVKPLRGWARRWAESPALSQKQQQEQPQKQQQEQPQKQQQEQPQKQ
jgi:hypothetical protein